MSMSTDGQTNRLLGYPADARLLIVNADDFGMCHAVNEAVFGALKEGLVRSTTLMVPCPWAIHPALDNPELFTIEPNGKHNRQMDFDF